MSAPKPRPADHAYLLRLFVVPDDPNSVLAEENLRHICAEYLHGGDCTIVVVDILKDFQVALDENILVTPTLLVDGPRGRQTLLGNLSDIDRIVLTFASKA